MIFARERNPEEMADPPKSRWARPSKNEKEKNLPFSKSGRFLILSDLGIFVHLMEGLQIPGFQAAFL